MATMMDAAVCCSSGKHTYRKNVFYNYLTTHIRAYVFLRTCGADMRQMLPRYPLVREKSSMMAM